MQHPSNHLDYKLLTTCAEGDLQKVIKLLQDGANVNAQGPLNRLVNNRPPNLV